MSKQRDEHIQKLMERANRDRQAQTKPTAARARVVKSAEANRPLKNGRMERSDGIGKNGRQAVEPSAPTKRAPLTRSAVGKSAGEVDSAKNSTPQYRPAQKGSSQPPINPSKGNVAKKQPQKIETESEIHIWISLVLFAIAGYLLLSCVSYLIYWEQDADLAYFSRFFDFNVGVAQNWGGKLGAILAQLIMGRWVGLTGLLVPLVFAIGGLRMLRVPTLEFRKAIRSTIAIMLVGSLALGHFMGFDPSIFGSGWGGEAGIYVSQWLTNVIGNEGTSLLIMALTLSILYFANVRWLRQVGRAVNNYFERQKLRKIEAARRQAEAVAEARALHAAKAEAARQAAIEAAQLSENKVFGASMEGASEINADGVNLAAAVAIDSPVNQAVAAIDNLDANSNQNLTTNVNSTENSISEVQPLMQPLTQPVDQAQVAVNQSNDPYKDYVAQYEESIASPTAMPVDWSSQLIELVGDQWGYVYNYEADGNPIYCYLDKVTMAQMAATAQNAVGARKLVERPIKEKPIDDDDIEFTVYTLPDEPMSANDSLQAVGLSVDNEAVVAQYAPPSMVNSLPNQMPTTATPMVEVEQNSVRTAATPGLDFAVAKAPEEEKLTATDINTMALYDPTAELPSYRRPMLELLKDHTQKVTVTPEELRENKDRIVHTLSTFGIKIDTIKATIGPTVTLYEIVPAPGVRISKIKNLEDDIALTLSALGIRIIAPIPGKGTIGIEVPNKEKETVSMYSVIRSAKFQDMKAELPVALGKTIQNETYVLDLAKMPHLLVAGATGQGKSVGLNAIITSLLYKKHPSELKFILVDPKKVELTLYAKLEKHFLAKMEGEEEAIITDTQKVIYTLNAVCKEMDDRYNLLKAAQVRNIVEYNDKFIHRRLNPEKGHRFLPYFVVVIDEFADLIMTAGREIETPIARIAQLARAVGIHLIIATQRPTTNIITGVIKANFPARIAFRVSSMIDSRTILDSPGANQLIGRGDMLVSTGNETTRVQCAFIDTPEVDDITEFISSQRGYVSAYELPEFVPESEAGSSSRDVDSSKRDPLFEEVARFVVGSQSGSASTIQRRFSIGFNRAGRLIDQLEAAGIVGRQEGSKPRQVLMSDPISLEMILGG